MNRKIAVLDTNSKDIFEEYFKNSAEVVLYNSIDEAEGDILALDNYFGEIPERIFNSTKILNIHPSLLPAFANSNALIQAYTSGVKVSGVTVHYVDKNNFYGRILAQYPLILDSSMHYNQYVDELTALGNKLYAPVVESVLDDVVFDFSKLFKNNCSGSCFSCKKCKK